MLCIRFILSAIALFLVLPNQLSANQVAVTPLPPEIRQAAADGDSSTVSEWLKSGGDIDAQDEYAETMMYMAALKGQSLLVNLLLERGANPGIPTCNGVTPLSVACSYGHLEIVRMLITAGANVNEVDKLSRSALECAVWSSDTNLLRLLLDNGADLSHLNDKGQTAADVAAHLGRLPALQFFLDHGCPLEGYGREGEVTPIEAAWGSKAMLYHGIDTDMSGIEENWKWYGSETFSFLLNQGARIEWLNLQCFEPWQRALQFDVPELAVMKLRAGFTVNTIDSLGRHPLLVCARFNSARVARLLIEGGADPNVSDSSGLTPMVMAAENDASEIIDLLIDCGISANARSADGTPVLLVSLRNGAYRAAAQLLQRGADRRVVDNRETALLMTAVTKSDTGFVRTLLEWGFDPNSSSPGGKQPLHIAALSGNGVICKLLLDAGADPNARDSKGDTPLAYAFSEGRFSFRMDAIQTLLKMGADVNLTWGRGETPLKQAVLYQDIKFTRTLLEYGANPNLTDAIGLSPLGYCRGDSSVETAQLLISFGADTNSALPQNGKALAEAVQLRDVKLVDFFIGKGFVRHLNEGDFKSSPLYVATARGDTAITRRLLRAGADPNRGLVNKESIWTDDWIFNIAVIKGDTAMMRILIEGGIKVNLGIKQFYENNWSDLVELVIETRRRQLKQPLITESNEPHVTESKGLFWAAYYNACRSAEILLEAGADPNHKDRQQQTPLWWAVNAPEGYQRSDADKSEVTDILLAHGANPDQTDIAGNNLLCFSADHQADWMVSRLLKAGAPVDSKQNGLTPILLASKKGDLKIVKMLVEAGANVNQSDLNGLPAIVLAERSGNQDLVKYLKRQKATSKVITPSPIDALFLAISSQDVESLKNILKMELPLNNVKEDGVYPLNIAVQVGNVEIVKMLMEAGARQGIRENSGKRTVDYLKDSRDIELFKVLRLEWNYHKLKEQDKTMEKETDSQAK